MIDYQVEVENAKNFDLHLTNLRLSVSAVRDVDKVAWTIATQIIIRKQREQILTKVNMSSSFFELPQYWI